MKIIFPALAALLFLAACNNKQSPKKESPTGDSSKPAAAADTVKTPLVGDDRDEHGCIGSAGYTWSVVKNDCIRIFETGIRLNAAEAVTDKTTSAFAVFSDDKRKAELYIPNQSATGIILEQGKSEKAKWTADSWLLEKTANGLLLKKNGVVQYTQ